MEDINGPSFEEIMGPLLFAGLSLHKHAQCMYIYIYVQWLESYKIKGVCGGRGIRTCARMCGVWTCECAFVCGRGRRHGCWRLGTFVLILRLKHK